MFPHPSCVQVHRTDFSHQQRKKLLGLHKFKDLNEVHTGTGKENEQNHVFNGSVKMSENR